MRTLFFCLALMTLPGAAAAAEPEHAETGLLRCGGYFVAPDRLPPDQCGVLPNLKATDSPVVLFLNFEGGTITSGQTDAPESNVSWIPDYDTVEIPPFDHAPYVDALLPDREAVLDAVVGWVRYYYAPFDVRVTRVRPENLPYQMMMVGGAASDVLSSPGATVGISPFDCGNRSRTDVNFCFSENLGSLDDVVTTIVHENGHSLGLAHIDDVTAVMNPYVTNDPWWQSGSLPAGEGTSCEGSYTQDSYAMLGENLGELEDLEAPWVDFLNPGQGARVHPTTSVLLYTGDEDSLGRWVELFLDDESRGEKTWPDFEWRLNNIPEGKHTLRAVVRDLGGNTSITTVSITVDAECAANGSCTEGKRGISEPCARESSCNIGLCVVQVEGDGAWCSTFCTPDTSSCAPGMQCVLHENGSDYYCADGPGPVILKTNSGDHLLSCTSTPGRGTGTVSLLWLFGLALIALRRRAA